MTTWQCIVSILIVTVEYKCYQPHYCTPWRWCWWAHGRTAPPSPASSCLCCTETQPAHRRQNMRSFDASMFWVAVGRHSSSGCDAMNPPEQRQHSWVELSRSFQSLQRPPPSDYCCSTDRYSDCHRNFHKGHRLSP